MLVGGKKKILLCTIVILAIILSTAYIIPAYAPTNRDTKTSPHKVSYYLIDYDDYNLLYEPEILKYYYLNAILIIHKQLFYIKIIM